MARVASAVAPAVPVALGSMAKGVADPGGRAVTVGALVVQAGKVAPAVATEEGLATVVGVAALVVPVARAAQAVVTVATVRRGATVTGREAPAAGMAVLAE